MASIFIPFVQYNYFVITTIINTIYEQFPFSVEDIEMRDDFYNI